MKNTKGEIPKINKHIEKAIDYFIDFLSSEHLEALKIFYNNNFFDFRSQLLSRYRYKFPIHKHENLNSCMQDLVFTYLSLLKKQEFEEWRKEIYQELDNLFIDHRPHKILDSLNRYQTLLSIFIPTTVHAIIAFSTCSFK